MWHYFLYYGASKYRPDTETWPSFQTDLESVYIIVTPQGTLRADCLWWIIHHPDLTYSHLQFSNSIGLKSTMETKSYKHNGWCKWHLHKAIYCRLDKRLNLELLKPMHTWGRHQSHSELQAKTRDRRNLRVEFCFQQWRWRLLKEQY